MTRLVTVLSIVGILVIFGLNLAESSYSQGLIAGQGANQCSTKYVYRRGVDTMSPEELRRLANARVRNARIGP